LYVLIRAARQIPIVRWLFLFDWRVDARLGLGQVWRAPLRALYGQCSLWMFLVYTLCMIGIVEPIYRRCLRWPVVARATSYGVLIVVAEWLLGWTLFRITGYRIWYYADSGAIGGMTSLYALPMFIGVGGLGEVLYRSLLNFASAASIQRIASPMTIERSGSQNMR
jgi:hypothetical protein